ncbi:MAG: HMA2 domain-containing protein [Methylocystis sp.]
MQDTPAQAFEASSPPSPTPPPAAEKEHAPPIAIASEAVADEDGGSTAKKKKKKKLKLGMKVEHQTAGRVRMKVPAGKGNAELLQQIGETFAGIPGIERVTANPTTGSLVLHYDRGKHESVHRHLRGHMGEDAYEPPPTQIDELASKIEREAEFLAEHSHTARTIVHICKRLDREIKLRTHNVADLKIGLAGAIVGLSILEIGATAATPVWLTLGVFTLNHFVELQRHHALEEKVDRQAPIILKGDKDKTSPPPA